MSFQTKFESLSNFSEFKLLQNSSFNQNYNYDPNYVSPNSQRHYMHPSQPHNAMRNLNSQFEDYECGNQEFELDDDETVEIDVSTIPNPSAIRGKKVWY